LAFFAQTTDCFSKIFYYNTGFILEKHQIFFAENWQKHAEICAHNIDPWSDTGFVKSGVDFLFSVPRSSFNFFLHKISKVFEVCF
jgi:hypothetical protein